ncbi:ABC transporter permease [Halanaerobacter jeridensis]|uniref:Tungstate transport system permease protein n=1 Tax=Halanaerobacter jeridensis TaxID=706427 RepID=A0A938XVN1_9FIRM|nr:ABC transporter permease [Halanaerobacter jeridensis]MBM7557674.1 tungstate transport system permease protein [Halanaerobacter jeridensis]
MDYILEGLSAALRLLFNLNPEIREIALLSIMVSTSSTLIASLLGIPLGFVVAHYDFQGKGIIITILNTLLSLPTVVVGLLVFSFISNQGPLGNLELLYTPLGIIMGQTILALPIVVTLSLNVIKESEDKIIDTALSLGASKKQAMILLFKEVRFGILGAVITAYGRVIGEVGLSMMVGGNIRRVTRTLTTAIAMETSKGEFGFGLALGIILMTIALAINLVLHYFQEVRT